MKGDLTKIARRFREEIDRTFGKKCKDFSFGCIICQAHRIVDDLEELAEFIEDLDKPLHRKKGRE